MKIRESIVYNAQQVRQLIDLVAQGEGTTLEFKRKVSHPEKVVREMIAFANTGGGVLLVGIADDGSIPGLKYPEDESHVISEALKKVSPALPVLETFIPLGGSRTVLQYKISESRSKPHFIDTENNSRESFIRIQDKSIKASREMREIMKRKQLSKDVHFRYGEYERILMKYLEAHQTITLKEYMLVSGLKRFIASKKLVVLVLANVLRVIPSEKGDQYTLAFGKFS